MKKAAIFLALGFFLQAAHVNAEVVDPIPDKDERWLLPSFFMRQSPPLATEWIALEKNDSSLTVAFKSACTKLNVAEKKIVREKFYFGRSITQIAPTCILSKFEFMMDGVMHAIPPALLSQFADAPLAHSVKWNSLSKTRVVAFDGGFGDGRYEVLLTFRAGHLIKQQVVAYDPLIKKKREFILEFDEKSLP